MWTATAAVILAKVERLAQHTSEARHQSWLETSWEEGAKFWRQSELQEQPGSWSRQSA